MFLSGHHFVLFNPNLGMVYGGEAYFEDKGWVSVAIKTLKEGAQLEEKIDFLSEANMMKRFHHKNIVELLGVCTRCERRTDQVRSTVLISRS